ncbi:MAG: ABC transporter substrate-binding protein [Nitrospinae bacterium]|nr:ABC transporter substrate-binding protein [Nitrospinota bacterium]
MRLSFAGILLALAALAGCQRADRPPAGFTAIAIESGPAVINPLLSTDAAAAKVEGLIFNGLLKRDDDFSLKPDLAEKWDYQTPLKLRITLRRNVKFHDGSPFTSADVKAAFDFILNEKNSSPLRGSFSEISSVDTLDDFTLMLTLKRQSAPLLGNLTFGVPKAGTANSGAPMGTGPFILKESVQDEKLVLVRNDLYFEGAPKLAGVIVKIIPDETVRVLSLESGAVSAIMNPITPDILPRFQKNAKLNVATTQSVSYSYLGFNMEDHLTGNIAVRRAIAYGIDRESIINFILKGMAIPATGPLPPGSEFYSGAVAQYPYDPEKAMRILDEAGFEDPDGPGPQLRFTLRYSTSQNELRRRIAEVMKWQLEKIGVGLDVRSYEWGAFYADIRKGAFQLFSLTWVGVGDPDILHYMFHSSSMPPDGANRGRYRNQELDGLLERGRVAEGTERKTAYNAAQKIIAVDLPYVSLWHPLNVAVTASSLKGFKLGPDENIKSLKTAFMEN